MNLVLNNYPSFMKIGKVSSVAKNCLSFHTEERTSQTDAKERDTIADVTAKYCKCCKLLYLMNDTLNAYRMYCNFLSHLVMNNKIINTDLKTRYEYGDLQNQVSFPFARG